MHEPLAPNPDDLAWLAGLVRHAALLPDADLRRQWLVVLPWLTSDQRYELAATLLEAEQAASGVENVG